MCGSWNERQPSEHLFLTWPAMHWMHSIRHVVIKWKKKILSPDWKYVRPIRAESLFQARSEQRVWGSKMSVPVHVIQGIGGKAPHILKLGNKWEWWTALPDRLKIWKDTRFPWIISWVGSSADVGGWEERRTCYSWTESNRAPSSPHPSHYTDWATLATTYRKRKLLSKIIT